MNNKYLSIVFLTSFILNFIVCGLLSSESTYVYTVKRAGGHDIKDINLENISSLKIMK